MWRYLFPGAVNLLPAKTEKEGDKHSATSCSFISVPKSGNVQAQMIVAHT